MEFFASFCCTERSYVMCNGAASSVESIQWNVSSLSFSYPDLYYRYYYCCIVYFKFRRSQWPSGLRRGSAAARLLRLWVQIPPGAWMPVSCECCVLSGRGLCDELITRPEESYRLWCVIVCDLETS